jgi:hypothetical protein
MKKVLSVLILLALLMSSAYADTLTTNLGLTKPTAPAGTWGERLNANFDLIDAAIGAGGGANLAHLNANQTFTGTNTFGLPFILSGSGGANQFLKQSSLGGAISVGAIGDADVPDTITLTNITQITTRSHASLQNLSADDHTIYALLAGRSGGQTLIGGTAAADGLTLQATAGVGAGSEFIKFLLGNNGATEAIRMVVANGQGILRINRPTAGTSPLSVYNISDSANLANFIGDGANANFQMSAYVGSAAGPTFIGVKGRGSLASPSQTLSGDNLIAFTTSAINASGGTESNLASFQATVSENITTTAHGSFWQFFTVANGSTTQILALKIDQDQSITIPQIKSTTGVRYVCVDTNGKLVSQAAACSGT